MTVSRVDGIVRQSGDNDQEHRQSRSELFEELLVERYSCRAFLPQPVSRGTITQILHMAQRTASWCNSQPWQVTITSGAATDRFRKAFHSHVIERKGERGDTDLEFPREYKGIYLARKRECGFQLYESVGIKRGDREASRVQALKNFTFFDAPHVAVITTEDDLGTYGAIDCGAYVNNFALAARSLGIATIAQAALASQSVFVRSFLGLPQHRLVVCGISFGFETPSHPANAFRTKRATLEDTVNWIDI
jgi:nitroreductase